MADIPVVCGVRILTKEQIAKLSHDRLKSYCCKIKKARDELFDDVVDDRIKALDYAFHAVMTEAYKRETEALRLCLKGEIDLGDWDRFGVKSVKRKK